MKVAHAISLGSAQRAPATQEDNLPLISSAAPVAAAADIEIVLPAGYSFYEVRWSGVGKTGSSAGNTSFKLDMKNGDNVYGGDSLGVITTLNSVGLVMIGGLGASGFWYAQPIPDDTVSLRIAGRPTHVKLFFNAATFDGTGKFWLHGIAS